jgi:hypothetical protein
MRRSAFLRFPASTRSVPGSLRAGALCLVLFLSACGDSVNDPPHSTGNNSGTTSPASAAACTSAHCAPAP